jgi:hypothetical protein
MYFVNVQRLDEEWQKITLFNCVFDCLHDIFLQTPQDDL